MKRIGHIIAGRETAGSSRRTAPVFNPATGARQAEVVLADGGDVDMAVAAAKAAFADWALTPPARRAQVMFNFRRLLGEAQEEAAKIISAEHGKTHADALGEVARGLEVVDYACGIPAALQGAFSRNVASGMDCVTERAPLGVAVGITPFNFPLMVPLWMIAMALACGNAFILKPSERDPSCGALIADLLKQAGLPDGVFNVLQGDREAVEALLAHPDVKAVSFVGSTPVARHVYVTGTAHGKRVQALGGAKNHMVIMPDADLEQAADALMGAGYGSAGERCMAISVAVPVGDRVADRLVELLAPRVRALKVGPSTDPASQMGPLITRQHMEKVAGYIGEGQRDGATLVVDGRGLSVKGCEQGYFLGGSLFDHVRPEMSIYREEIFGPVLSIVRARDYDEALRLIDGCPYGNGVAIFTRDGDAARDFTTRVEVGMVGVNVPIPVPVGFHSFGGWRDSAFGDHGIYGPEAVHFYTRAKTAMTRWPTGIRAGAEFSFPGLG